MKKGMSVAGLSLGVVGIVLSTCAIVFSAIGMTKKKKHNFK